MVARRAISVQLTRVKRGQSRLLPVCEVGCSAALSVAICPIPKLIVQGWASAAGQPTARAGPGGLAASFS